MKRFMLIVVVVVAIGLVALPGNAAKVPLPATPSPCNAACASVLSKIENLVPDPAAEVSPYKVPCEAECGGGGTDPNLREVHSNITPVLTKYHYSADNYAKTLFRFQYAIFYYYDGYYEYRLRVALGQNAPGQVDIAGGWLSNDRGERIIKFDWGSSCCSKPNELRWKPWMTGGRMKLSTYGDPHDFLGVFQTSWSPSSVESSTHIDNWQWGPWHTD